MFALYLQLNMLNPKAGNKARRFSRYHASKLPLDAADRVPGETTSPFQAERLSAFPIFFIPTQHNIKILAQIDRKLLSTLQKSRLD